MPFLLGCAALFFPRIVLLLVWVFGGGWLMQAYEHWIWPVLGLVFLPLTTLAFAFAFNSMGSPGEIAPLGWVIVIVAMLFDLGLLGGGARSRRRRKS